LFPVRALLPSPLPRLSLLFFSRIPPPPLSPLFPYTTLFRSGHLGSMSGLTESGRLAAIGTLPGDYRHSRNERYGIWIGTAASLRLDAPELDHLGPLLGLGGNELAEVDR